MFERPLLVVVNHLLDSEDWARARLKPFAGRHARFESGPLALTVTIGPDGTLLGAGDSQVSDVSIRIPDDAPFRLLSDPGSLFPAARISGTADFAEALGFVFRHLRWDAEADLAKFTGDIVARRLLASVTSFAGSRREAASRLGENLVEYAADEAGWILRPQTLSAFSTDIRQLHDDLARLETRIAHLG